MTNGDPNAWARRMEGTIWMCNLAKINHLYGVRFLEIYASELEEVRASFREIMNARCQKAEIIYEGRMRASEVEFKEISNMQATESLELTRKALKISRYMLVASMAVAAVTIVVIIANL